MAPGVIKEDSVGLPFKSKKAKLKATVSAENSLTESIAYPASNQESSYISASNELYTRINNKWNNFHNTITDSDVNDIIETGFMYFGDILIVHCDYEYEFVNNCISEFDAYRIGSQEKDVYESIGIYESMSEQAMGVHIQNKCMYEFIDEMYSRYTIAELMGANDSFIFGEFICINL